MTFKTWLEKQSSQALTFFVILLVLIGAGLFVGGMQYERWHELRGRFDGRYPMMYRDYQDYGGRGYGAGPMMRRYRYNQPPPTATPTPAPPGSSGVQ